MRETVVDATREPFSVLVLGVQGENDATVIRFDYSKWLKEYGQGTFALIHKRAGEPEPEPVYVTLDNGVASWMVTSSDTRSIGRGVAEATFRVNDVVVKTRRYITNVTESISEIEDPTSNWQELLIQTAEANQAQMIAHDREFAESQQNRQEVFEASMDHWAGEINYLTDETNELIVKATGISNRAEEALADATVAKNRVEQLATQTDDILDEAREALSTSHAASVAANIALSKATTAANMANTKADLANTAADRANQISDDLTAKLNNGYFDGDSAYEVAVKNGFSGTEAEWLQSLKQASEDAAAIALATMTNVVDNFEASQEERENAFNEAQSDREAEFNSSMQGWNSSVTNVVNRANTATTNANDKATLANTAAQAANDAARDLKQRVEAGEFKGDPGPSPVITATKQDGITTIYSDGMQIGQIKDGAEFGYTPLHTVWANNTYHIEDEQGNTKTFAEIVALFNDPDTFVYVVSSNVIHIPAFVEAHGMEFQGSYIYNEVGHLRRVIINDQNQVRISDIDLETSGYKTNDIHNWAVDENDPYYPTASAVVDYVGGEVSQKADSATVNAIQTELTNARTNYIDHTFGSLGERMNAIEHTIHAISQDVDLDPRAIHEIIQSGEAREVFQIGDQLSIPWTDVATGQQHIFQADICHHFDGSDDEHPLVTIEDGSQVKGMGIMFHRSIPFGIVWNAKNAFYVPDEDMPAGTYCFKVSITTKWGSVGEWSVLGDRYFNFTTAAPIVAGSQLMFSGDPYNAKLDTMSVQVFPQFDTSVQQTCAISAGQAGTEIGTISHIVNGNMNTFARSTYGDNSWYCSDEREWLNSDKPKSEWNTQKQKWHRPHTLATTKAGFLTGFSADLLAIIGNVMNKTETHAGDSQPGIKTTYDRFFPLSARQHYFSNYLSETADGYNQSGVPWDYWKQLALANGKTAPWAGWGTFPELITYDNTAQTTARYCWLRSAYRSGVYSNGVGTVYTSGAVSYSTASSGYFAVPACVLV